MNGIFRACVWALLALCVSNGGIVAGAELDLPATQMAQMKEVSPAYQFERLHRPVLLVHGTDDPRVAFEHSLRLRILAGGRDTKTTWLPLRGVGHGLSTMPQWLAVYSAADLFLQGCLKPGSTRAGTSTASGL